MAKALRYLSSADAQLPRQASSHRRPHLYQCRQGVESRAVVTGCSRRVFTELPRASFVQNNPLSAHNDPAPGPERVPAAAPTATLIQNS